MNEMILHGHQSFRGAVLWGWLKRFPLQYHFIHGLATTLASYDEAWLRQGLVGYDQRRPPTATLAKESFLA
jgi:hypothetical protein